MVETVTPKETLLLVEDEPAIRQLMRRMLEQHGYLLLEARNGEEALRLAETHSEQIHLLVTDIVMPGLNGFDLADRFVALHPETRVLFLSGHGDHPTVRQRLRDTQRPFLLKPYTQEALAQSIRQALET